MSVTTAARYATTVGQGSAGYTWDAGTLTAGNLNADDANYALCTGAAFDLNVITNEANLSNFGFTIPTTATILGIAVQVNRARTAGTSAVDNVVQLTKSAGTPIGTNKADTTTNYGASNATITYGGAADLWGTTWTPAEINATGFGMQFRAQATANNVDIRVGFISIAVTYTTYKTVSAVTATLKAAQRRTAGVVTAALKRSGIGRTVSTVTAVLAEGSSAVSKTVDAVTATLSRTATRTAASVTAAVLWPVRRTVDAVTAVLADYRDMDYIESGADPVADSAVLRLTPVIDPNASTGQYVRYRYRKSVTSVRTVDLTVALLENAVEIASWTHSDVGTEWTQANQLLTDVQADSITATSGYASLRVKLTATSAGVGAAVKAQVSWVEFDTTGTGGAVSYTKTVANAVAALLWRGRHTVANATAALLLTSTRTVASVTAAIKATQKRTVDQVAAALAQTFGRTVDLVTAALTASQRRTVDLVTATLSLLGVGAKTVQFVTAAIKQTGIGRTATAITAALARTYTRTVGAVAAVLSLIYTRTVDSVTAALQASQRRSVLLVTAALELLGVGTKTVQEVTAALLLATRRTVGAVTASIALVRQRTVDSVAAALLAQTARTVDLVTAAIKQAGIARAVDLVTAAVSLAVGRTVASVTAVITFRFGKTVDAISAALKGSPSRIVATVTAVLRLETLVPAGPCQGALSVIGVNAGALSETRGYSAERSEQRAYAGTLSEVLW